MTQTAPGPHADARQFSADSLKAFIETRRRRGEPPGRIAAAGHAYFGVALDAGQIAPYRPGEIALSTQTEHRQDKESVQLPADQPPEPNFTRLEDIETPARALFSIAPESAVADAPGPVSGGADADVAPQHRQDTDKMRNPRPPENAVSAAVSTTSITQTASARLCC